MGRVENLINGHLHCFCTGVFIILVIVVSAARPGYGSN